MDIAKSIFLSKTYKYIYKYILTQKKKKNYKVKFSLALSDVYFKIYIKPTFEWFDISAHNIRYIQRWAKRFVDIMYVQDFDSRELEETNTRLYILYNKYDDDDDDESLLYKSH